MPTPNSIMGFREALRPRCPRATAAVAVILCCLAGGSPPPALAQEALHSGDTACPTWQGVVVDPTAQPIRNATVRARERSVETDSAGQFELAGAGAEEEIRIDAWGFAPWRRPVPCAERARPARVGLEPAEILRGRLLREDGGAVTAAVAHLEWIRDGTAAARATRELDPVEGTFRLVLPGTAAVRVSVAVEGFQRLDLGEWQVGAGSEVDTGPWILDAGAEVAARLLDRETAAPVPGAHLEVVPVGRASIGARLRGEAHRGSSDAEGAVTVSGLEPGRYAITHTGPRGERGLRIATLRRGERLDLGMLWVDAGVTLAGRVLQRDGSPVGAAAIRLYDPAAEVLDPFAETRTGPDGSFGIPALASGEYLLRVGSPAIVHSALERVARPSTEREIVLSGVRLRGRALRDGLPLAGATLVVESASDRSRSRQKLVVNERRPDGSSSSRVHGASATRCEVTTGPTGEFSCPEVLPGISVATWLAGLGEVTRFLEVPDAEEAVFELDFGGSDLAGILRAPVGGGPAAAIVQAVDGGDRRVARTTAAGDGSFVLQGLPDRPILVQAKGFAGDRAELGPLSPREAPSPIVLDLAAQPERDLEVELRGASDLGPLQPELVLLDATGELVAGALVSGERALFRKVAPGAYWMAWDDATYGAGMRPLEHDLGGGSKRTVLKPEAGGTVGVECDAIEHGERAIRSVRVQTEDGGDVTPFLSGAVPGLRFSPECRLALGRLAAGRYVLEIAAGGDTSRRTFSVRDGDEVWLRFP